MRNSIAAALVAALALSLLTPSNAQAADLGESVPIDAILADLVIGTDEAVGYDRALFEHWIDADGDGCDTRQEVLIEESISAVTVGTGCALTGGGWYSWFDGVTWTASGDVDIDHVVPLAEAWRSGASGWGTETRRSFANDLAFGASLAAVTDSVNQSKGDRDPAEWLPPLTDAVTECRYVTEWVLVKHRWGLTVDVAEHAAIEQAFTRDDCGATPVTVPESAVEQGPGEPRDAVIRYSGATRYDVAVNIAKEYEPGVEVIYVAKGTDFPDALSAAPAAAAQGGPLLLTSPDSLLPAVRDEIARLQPQKIVVVGGTASITPSVFAALETLSPEVIRIGGADRFEASRNLNEFAFGVSGARRVYLATGLKFPDALSASAAAGAIGGAVLLVNGTQGALDAQTAATIGRLAPLDAIIAGGPASVTPGIEAGVVALSLPEGARRLGGADRFEAGRNINSDVFTAADQVFLATGLNFPDALAGAALAGRNSAPLYITPGTCVPYSVTTDIAGFGSPQLVILGGPNSMSAATEALVPCGANPTISLGFSCASGISYTASNPNPFSIATDIGIDANGDGTVEANERVTLPPGQSSGSNLGFPAEDSTVSVVAVVNGVIVASASIRVDCVPPVVTPPANPGDSKNCSDFGTYAEAKAWFDTYYPYYGDVAQLDQNNDLRPCESLPGFTG